MRLAIRRPRRVTSTVGSYVARTPRRGPTLLMAAGPAPVTFEVWPPMTDPGMLALQAIADRVAETCLASPRGGHLLGDGHPGRRWRLFRGAHRARRRLDPSSSSCPPAIRGAPLGSPGEHHVAGHAARPATGFVTGSAEGLGGLASGPGCARASRPGRRSRCRMSRAHTIAIEVAGTLSEALPDERMPSPFAVRTPEASIPR